MSRKSPLHGRTFLGLTARTLMLVAAALLVLAYLASVLNPARVWWMSLFGTIFPLSFLLNAVLLVWALRRRSRALWIPLLALLPSLFFFGRILRVPFSAQESAREGDIRMVSYNVGRFRTTGGADADSIVRFLRKADADIICLQEYAIRKGQDMQRDLRRRFPRYPHISYYAFQRGRRQFGNVTLSRYPIRKKGVINFENSTNLAIWTDLSIGGETVRVYNCHLESYAISPGRLYGRIRKDEDALREAGDKMRSSITKRPDQADRILSHIAASPRVALVCGDFNDTPLSYTYTHLMRGRKDSFVEAGRGFGATYSFLWPALRIDYVLYPEKDFRAVSHRSPHLPYSDHYPVVTVLRPLS